MAPGLPQIERSSFFRSYYCRPGKYNPTSWGGDLWGSFGVIDPVCVASGFSVGLLVGLTGVGGGSLMTPILILLFGVHPSTAVGTDLLYAAATKSGGVAVHGWARTIHWPAVIRLGAGSVPASLLTLLVLWQLDLSTGAARGLVNSVLCFALILTATALIFRKLVIDKLRVRMERVDVGCRYRPLDHGGDRLAVIGCAPDRFVAGDRDWQLFCGPRSRNCAAAVAGRDSDRGRRQA